MKNIYKNLGPMTDRIQLTPFEIGQIKAHLHHGLGPGASSACAPQCLDWLTLTEEAAVEQGSLVVSLVSHDLLRIVALRKQHEHKRELLSLSLSLALVCQLPRKKIDGFDNML